MADTNTYPDLTALQAQAEALNAEFAKLDADARLRRAWELFGDELIATKFDAPVGQPSKPSSSRKEKARSNREQFGKISELRGVVGNPVFRSWAILVGAIAAGIAYFLLVGVVVRKLLP